MPILTADEIKEKVTAIYAAAGATEREAGIVAGLLIESNLRSGRQTWRPAEPLEAGLSITDACLGWNRTEGLLRELAGAHRRARSEATRML